MSTSISEQKAKRNEADQEHLPVAFGATVPTSSNASPKRIRNRKRFDEAISPNAERSCDIRSTDVIFGRGKCYQEHPGNRRMRAIIRQYKEQYSAISRSKKRDLVEALYSEITQDGARFLHKSAGEDTFVVVDIPIALEKVRNTLRCKKCKKSFGTSSATNDDFGLPKPASSISNSGGGSLIGLNDSATDTYAHDCDRVAARYGSLPTQLALNEQQKLTTMHPLDVGRLVRNDLLSQRYHAGVAIAQWLQAQPSPFESMRLLEGRSIGIQSPWLGPSPSLPQANYRDISLPVPGQQPHLDHLNSRAIFFGV